MIRTKKILALFLAVVLMFSALPFSVSADEVEIVEMDTPILFAQDPFNTVKSEVEGGTNYMTSVGVTRESIVRELEAHEHDSYYLGTKYVGGDAQSPNGDTSYNSGTVGMNCGGFVSYVLRKAGLDADLVMEIMHRTPVNQFGSGLPYDWLAGASNYKNLIENGQISAYAFRTKQELLSSGLAEKGDIILMWWSDNPGADGADNHIGFFWGEASDDDVMWHSGTEPSSGNQISAITPKTPGSFYILIKIEPLQPKEYEVTLTKTSADVSITQGNSAYSLAGATYNVYKGTSGTGSVVGLLTFQDNMLLGLGVMLAAGEVPRIAQQFGLDSSVKVNMMSVVHATSTAVNMTRNTRPRRSATPRSSPRPSSPPGWTGRTSGKTSSSMTPPRACSRPPSCWWRSSVPRPSGTSCPCSRSSRS